MSNGRVIILSGCSGSGKSTYAAKLAAGYAGHGAVAEIVCADDYFVVDGEYKFDAAGLGDAHAVCFRKFINALGDMRIGLVVVANTNQSAQDIAPYVLGAAAFGYDAEIVTIRCDPGVAAARNVHGVPEDKVRQQAKRIETRQLPGYWKQSVVESTL